MFFLHAATLDSGQLPPRTLGEEREVEARAAPPRAPRTSRPQPVPRTPLFSLSCYVPLPPLLPVVVILARCISYLEQLHQME
jgi:hypothetical protein